MRLNISPKRGLNTDLAAILSSDSVPWCKKKHLLHLNFCLFSIFLLFSSNGYDGSMMNGLLALVQWNQFMQQPYGAWLGFINAIQYLGAIVCFPFVVWSNDRFGRKPSIAIGYFWLLLGVSLQSAAQNPTMFVMGRLFIGVASTLFGISATCLVTETAFPTHRGVFTALSNCGWYIGSTFAAWATYGSRTIEDDWAWRIPSLLQIVGPSLALFGFCMAPESPRWLASQGKMGDTRKFLVKYHAGGIESSPLVEFEYAEITGTITRESQLAGTSSYTDMFRTKGNRHRLFISISLGVFSQWNGIGIVSYYFAPVLRDVGVKSVATQTMIAGFLQVWNIVFAIGGALLVDSIGRRKLFLTSCSGMLTTLILISVLSGIFSRTGKSAIGISVIPNYFLFSAFFDIAFTPLLYAYTCEIWPYGLRSRGLSTGMFTTSLAVFFNIFVNPIALDAIQWKYYIFYCGVLVVMLSVIWRYYPETSGHSLEEVSVIFDGEREAMQDN